MERNRNNDDDNANNNNGGGGFWGKAAAVGAGVLAIGGAYYLLSSRKKREEPQSDQPNTNTNTNRAREDQNTESNETGRSLSSYFTDILRMVDTPSTSTPPTEPAVIVSDSPVINNLNSLLADIYSRYIGLKNAEFEAHYNVFNNIFWRLHALMKEADPYYGKYSSTVQFAGSHYDRLRINKPDEFDMDIIISLPVNLRADPFNPDKSDIVLEPKSPGFIQLKMGTQFQNLPARDLHDWRINIKAYEWLDERNYLLRSKFIDWFKGVVYRAFNRFDMNANGRRFTYVDGVPYTLRLSSSGPAITLIIENVSIGFKLDVDLVPALKFPESRWPICRGYREIPLRCRKDIWMVVPKPNKAGLNRFDTERSWRLALHLQERELMYDTNNLRQAIRLIKKLRDSQGMNKIASYYIKTLFYLEVVERNDAAFWSRSNPATLFTLMVHKFHQALVDGNIPYFWHKENNLIGHIDRSTLTGYANKLGKLIIVLQSPWDYKKVAKFILSHNEFQEYNSRFLHI